MIEKKSVAGRHAGSFVLPDGQEFIGELSLCGGTSELTLRGPEEADFERTPGDITGHLLDGRNVTCLQCIILGARQVRKSDGTVVSILKLFPHTVVVGTSHVPGEGPCVAELRFTTQDVPGAFGDRRSFGVKLASKEEMKTLVPEDEALFTDDAGIVYFVGNTVIASVQTAVGTISICNVPTFRSDVTGPSIDNMVVVNVLFDETISIGEAQLRLTKLLRFLSIAVGRRQAVQEFSINCADGIGGFSWQTAYYSMAPASFSDDSPQKKIHVLDYPLSPAGRPAEFSKVLATWVDRDAERQSSRVQFVDSMANGLHFNTNRLVASANMFDLLPAEDVPVARDLPADLAEALRVAKAAIKAVAQNTDEKQSALGALGRVGGSTLTAKVLFRAGIVSEHLAAEFPDLDKVLKLAVKARNYFVHGSLDRISYAELGPFLPFLTEALEFVYAVSDFIECGWDVERWRATHGNASHPFTMFRYQYKQIHKELVDSGLIR